MAGLDLPTLVQKIRLDADTKGAEGQVQSGLGRVTGVMSKVGTAATIGLTVPILAFGAAGLKAATDVDKGLREVNTLFGLTGKAGQENFQEIRGLVQNLSADVGIAQDVLTKGLYNAISAGVPKENAFTFMQIASKAAVAGVTDVNTSVDGLTSIINAFGLDVTDAERVADSMFATVQGGKTTFSELSAAIFQIAPAAAASKVSMEEVNAAIATLTASGTPTAVAATQLRAALTGLQRPSEDLDAAFQKVGFANAQAAIESKGLAFSLGVVKDASGGSQGELTKLLGSVEAVAAANVIAGTGAGKMSDELDRQAQKAGATQTAFEEMERSNSRGIERLKVTVQNLSIALGNALLPMAQKIVGQFQKVLDVFSKMSPRGKALVGVALGIVAAFGPVLVISAKLIQSMQVLRGAFVAIKGVGLAGSLGAVAPFLPVALALAGAGLLLWKNWDKVKPVFDAVKSSVGQVIGILFQGDFKGGFLSEDSSVVDTAFKIRDAVIDLAGKARQLFDVVFRGDFKGGPFSEDSPIIDGAFKIREAVGRAVDFFQTKVQPVLERVGNFIKANLRPILIGLGIAFAALTAPVTTTIAAIVLAYKRFEGFRNVVDTVVRFIIGRVVPAIVAFAQGVGTQIGNLVGYFQRIAPQVQEAFGHVLAVVQGFLSFVATVLSAGMAVVREIIGVVLDVVAALWRAWGDDIGRIIGTLVNYVQETIENGLQLVRGIIQTVLSLINGDWGAAWDGIKKILGAIWDQIGNIISTAAGIVRSLIAGLASTVGQIWSGLWDMVKGVLSSAWGSISSAVSTGISSVVSFFSGLPGRAIGALGDIGTRLYVFFRTAVGRADDAARDAGEGIIRFMRDLPGNMISAVGNVGSRLVDMGEDLIRGLIKGIGNMLGAVKNAVGDVVGGAINTGKRLLGLRSPSRVFMEFGQMTGEGFAIGLRNMATDVGKASADMIGAAMPNARTTAFSGTMAGSGSGASIREGDVVLQFPNVRSADDADAIRSAVNDPGVLSALSSAIKAGRR